MKRKIIKQGAGTLTISLPTSWTKLFRLKQGDEIDVVQESNVLVVSTKEQLRSKSVELDLSGFSTPMIWIYLANAYIRGDDEVKVIFDDPRIMNEVSKASNDFIGFEVIEQGKKHCVLKDLSGTTEVDLDMILRRIFLLILSVAEEGLEALNKKDIAMLNQVLSQRDHEVNKLISFYLRNLNKRGLGDFQKAMHYHTIVNFIEHLADEYTRLYNEIEKPVCPESAKTFDDVVKLTRDFYDLFYKYNVSLAQKIRDKRDQIRAKTNKLMLNKGLNEIRFLYRVKKIAELIYDIEKIHVGGQI